MPADKVSAAPKAASSSQPTGSAAASRPSNGGQAASPKGDGAAKFKAAVASQQNAPANPGNGQAPARQPNPAAATSKPPPGATPGAPVTPEQRDRAVLGAYTLRTDQAEYDKNVKSGWNPGATGAKLKADRGVISGDVDKMLDQLGGKNTGTLFESKDVYDKGIEPVLKAVGPWQGEGSDPYKALVDERIAARSEEGLAGRIAADADQSVLSQKFGYIKNQEPLASQVAAVLGVPNDANAATKSVNAAEGRAGEIEGDSKAMLAAERARALPIQGPDGNVDLSTRSMLADIRDRTSRNATINAKQAEIKQDPNLAPKDRDDIAGNLDRSVVTTNVADGLESNLINRNTPIP